MIKIKENWNELQHTGYIIYTSAKSVGITAEKCDSWYTQLQFPYRNLLLIYWHTAIQEHLGWHHDFTEYAHYEPVMDNIVTNNWEHCLEKSLLERLRL
jgi:hypothetical protein